MFGSTENYLFEGNHQCQAKIADGSRSLKDCRLLIVEDEQDNFLYMNVLLRNLITRIDHAINGSEAIEMVSKSQYDIILMDLKMPEIDGIEATIRIKESHPDITILAQTAYATHEERESAMRAGCSDYLVKPIYKDDLIGMVSRYFSD